METALVLFNRDLRVHDNPALSAAARAARVVPLFVLDRTLLASRFAAPNRLAFMVDSLRDLDGALKARGGRLFVREGDPVREAVSLAREAGAGAIHVSADWSAYARRREEGLAAACSIAGIGFRRHPGVTIVEPGELTPADGDHFRVFSPYHRVWTAAELRAKLGAPRRLTAPRGPAAGRIPPLSSLAGGEPSPDLPPGGETEGRRRLRRFLRHGLGGYAERADDLAGEGTSRLSPYLRWGCVSPLEALREARSAGGDSFARQLCWRDFHHQVLAAYPRLPRRDYRHGGDRWSRSQRALEAWRAGRTGYPIVDAGMRQLAREGWMHNRARLIVASFLTKDLHLDWREGARHFWDLLVDGDIANNAGNWQWVAGTGNDTRPNRVFNPLRQAKRFDPDGDYVRRYVPELAGIDGAIVHEPWRIGPLERGSIDYPEPIVDHAEAAAEHHARRMAG
ncbi:MAG TPA: deoxyribodipyrimidine photo-lyase [Solirubrobacterales bacterium]|nr:deoxyribodipyrimidine photo-lyase [Solirubrobacterales bacterium]